jgi:Tol biopolymer transport system component
MRLSLTLGLCLALAGCGGSDGIVAPPESQMPPSVKVAYTALFADAPRLVVLNTGTHVQRTVSDSTNELVWSPDGSKLAYARVKATQQGEQVLWVWNEASGQSVQLDATPVTTLCDYRGCYVYLRPFNPAWSLDSREIAYLNGSEIRILSADGASRRVIALPAGTNAQSVAWTPDGRFVSYVDVSTEESAKAIRGVSAVSGGSPIILVQNSETIGEYAWSPDAKRVVITAGNAILVREGNVLLGSTPLAAVSPRWSPDGSRVAFYGTNAEPRDIYTINANGSDVRRVTYGDAGGSGLAWTSDGTMLVFSRYGLFFTDVRGGAVYKFLDDVGVFSITHP